MSNTKDTQPNVFHVLLTGGGPFFKYEINPSWLAIEPLHDATLHYDAPDEPVLEDDVVIMKPAKDPSPRPIKIHTLQIPIEYDQTLDAVPGLHTRPPTLPKTSDPQLPPPPGGYDFILHLGVAGRGPLRMERLGHKHGYMMKDSQGNHAPLVFFPASSTAEQSAEDQLERDRLAVYGLNPPSSDGPAPPTRGYGKGYEKFGVEMATDINIDHLNSEMKASGFDVYTSMDAGHFLCDFLYYGSLAESQRSATPYVKTDCSKVLFMHVPPVDQPLSTSQVTDAIKWIVLWMAKIEGDERAAEAAAAMQPSHTSCMYQPIQPFPTTYSSGTSGWSTTTALKPIKATPEDMSALMEEQKLETELAARRAEELAAKRAAHATSSSSSSSSSRNGPSAPDPKKT